MDLVGTNGCTALHVAAAAHDAERVRALLAGAGEGAAAVDVNAKTTSSISISGTRFDSGMTPLRVALRRGHWAAAKLLAEHPHHDPTLHNGWTASGLETELQIQGMTALHVAAVGDNAEARVRALLSEGGVDVNAATTGKSTRAYSGRGGSDMEALIY